MKSLNFSIGKVTKKISSKKDSRIVKIQQNWLFIVKEEYAQKIIALKLTGGGGDGRLSIGLKEPIDYFLYPEIKERVKKNVNEFFGKNIIKTVVIKTELL